MHLGLWGVKREPPPQANAPPPETLIFYDDSPSLPARSITWSILIKRLKPTSKKISRMQAARNFAKKFTGYQKIRIDNQIFIELLNTNLRSLHVSVCRFAVELGIQFTYYFRSFYS